MNYVYFIDYLQLKNQLCPESVTIEEYCILEIISNKDQEQIWFPCFKDEEDLKLIQECLNSLKEKSEE